MRTVPEFDCSPAHARRSASWTKISRQPSLPQTAGKFPLQGCAQDARLLDGHSIEHQAVDV
jgi:hypothetical protein